MTIGSNDNSIFQGNTQKNNCDQRRGSFHCKSFKAVTPATAILLNILFYFSVGLIISHFIAIFALLK